jgi:subtilase family serine protease
MGRIVARACALTATGVAALSLIATGSASAHSAHHQRAYHARHRASVMVPLAEQAPDTSALPAAGGTPDCTSPAPVHTYAYYHCYTPSDIRTAFGVDSVAALKSGLPNMGLGQTIVLVDAYGSPTAASDLQFFAQSFGLPKPNFDQVYPFGAPDYKNIAHGNGLSGPNGAAGWSGEATLDIEWSDAIAPLAHIVLLAVPPAETEGVQGLPNMFKAMQQAINTYPAGTVFSQSFGITEQTLGGASASQVAKFDAVYQAGLAKGDTFLASSGDNGATGAAKQHKQTATYPYATSGWPASSPWVTAAGGTQLQYGWTWDPTSNTPFLADGSQNAAYYNSTSSGNSEVVWNEKDLPAATGGGPSAIYPMPSWQSGVASAIGSNARGVPDIAWNAAVNGGVLVYITAYPNYQRAGWHVYGGTSAASPQLAGVVALANAARADDSKGPIGYLNPVLYSLPSSDYRDIVPVHEGSVSAGAQVDNTLWQTNADGTVSPGPVTGWPTTSGYDMTTGLGSPDVGPFVAAVAAQP